MNWQTVLIALFAAWAAVTAWAFWIEPRCYRLRKVKLSGFRKLSKPISILHLTDIHFVKNLGSKRGFFQRLSMLNPDLIVVTGDVIDCDEGIETAARCLSGLRGRYGTFLVLGNHDYYDYRAFDNVRYYCLRASTSPHRNNVEKFVRAMKDVGVRVLIDESVRLDIHGNPVLIAGTNDPLTQQVNFEKALHDLSPKTFNLLLMHLADGLLKLSHKGVDLVLSGHTHGGQIRLPFIGALYTATKLPRKYVDGANLYKGMHVFVSRGIGAGRFIFMRLFCPPEAVLLEVTP